ncbi:hypothetical protein [Bacillus phage SBSphiJ6]|nr:hypothetical protein [Bacillus phage SBSphiJ1]UPI12116.1 hypothetical protein [Bacillus phage SBSphiJ2]UPI12371.1 hypothetical protein [Bacillus phage SBSphiJ3]UPI12623.1 hypothetical protein [Bacillus phage SBSphiJ4]UPI13113.1 hypothetical protein [Bacillus phage SBSphiJ6]
MAKYRKKPVVVDAFLFNVDPTPDWFIEKTNSREIVIGYEMDSVFCMIPTLEGTMCGSEGDYIIRGVQGEIYPCKADIFEATYEKVE